MPGKYQNKEYRTPPPQRNVDHVDLPPALSPLPRPPREQEQRPARDGSSNRSPAATEVVASPETVAKSEGTYQKRLISTYEMGSLPEIEAGISNGSVVVGTLKCVKWTNSVAFCKNSKLPRDVAIGDNIQARGRALPGDLVAVALDPITMWGERPAEAKDPHVPQGILKEGAKLPDGRRIVRAIDHDSEKKEKRLTTVEQLHFDCNPPPYDWPPELQPKGKVIAVLERCAELLHPCLVQIEGPPPKMLQSNRYYRFKPYDETFPIVAVYGSAVPHYLQDSITETLVLVQIIEDRSKSPSDSISWVEQDRFPIGQVVQFLGKAGTAAAESRAIADTHRIHDTAFSDEAEACVPPEFIIPEPDYLRRIGRRDLREEEFVCTIDPATARDLDDALSIQRTPGGYRVGVHIADVSWFVKPNSALDDEARERSTSAYFVERVIPMLPRKLSEDYCSLHAGADKFAFSAIFQMDSHGKVVSEWFGQSVIRNRCRMCYADAQTIIDGDESGDSLVFHESELTNGVTRERLVRKVVNSMKLLYELATVLRKIRFDRGALSLNKRKLYFKFEDMNSRLAPKGYLLERTKEANWVIEEFMLLANNRVAEKIVEFLPECGLVRKHDPPIGKKMKAFLHAAKCVGLDISSGGSKQLNESMEKCNDHPNNDAIRLMATYCMSLAQYVSSGDDEVENISHYALALGHYTHFTSPIRRYADLVVHRQLLVALEAEEIVKLEKARMSNKDAEIRIAVSQLTKTKHLYIGPAEVCDIAENCNDKKEHARKASEESIKLFFCLYINALRSMAQQDSTLPQVFTLRGIVTRISKEKFSVYAREIATDVEIFHNSRGQRWVCENTFNEMEMNFLISWGANPKTGHEEAEVATLFSELIVVLEVTLRPRARLDFIILPPWERGVPTGVPSDLTRLHDPPTPVDVRV